MPAFRARTTINRPREEAFRFTADPENQPEWLLSVVVVRRLSGQRGQVGSVYQQSIREPEGLSSYELEVMEVEPGERFVYVSRADGPPVGVEYRFRDAEGANAGERATTVELAFHIRVGPFFRLIWPLAFLLRRGGGRQVAVVLERLKVALEGE